MRSVLRTPNRVLRWALSLLLVALTVASTASQAFGRFGYVNFPPVPGFDVSDRGFRALAAGATTFEFASKLQDLRARDVTVRSAGYECRPTKGCPDAFRVDLLAPGFQLHYASGLSIKLSQSTAPYLSWTEGSVGPDIPTPRVSWVLVTFHEAQPPVLIAFPGHTGSLVIHGSPGAWRIETGGAPQGWLRVCLPNGLHSLETGDAGSLGRAVGVVKDHEGFWTGVQPRVTQLQLSSDDRSLTASWSFDKAGAQVPFAALLSRSGGYPLRILSPVTMTTADLNEGPVAYTSVPKLTIRFPLRRVPAGRGVCLGDSPVPSIGTASPFDAPSVAELALANLLAARDTLALETAEAASNDYLEQATYTPEPNTRQPMPFGADGTNIDLAAAQALLMQVLPLSSGEESEPNALFTSVLWRQDWSSWMPAVQDAPRARFAAALAAVAGALSPDTERRFQAATFQAGLSAQRSLSAFRKRCHLWTPEGPTSEPLFSLRHAIFGLQPTTIRPSGFELCLFSPFRVLGAYSVSAQAVDDGILLHWDWKRDRPKSICFVTATPVQAIARTNLRTLTVKETLGTVVMRFEPVEEGTCSVLLKLPAWAVALPKSAQPQRVSPDAR